MIFKQIQISDCDFYHLSKYGISGGYIKGEKSKNSAEVENMEGFMMHMLVIYKDGRWHMIEEVKNENIWFILDLLTYSIEAVKERW